MATAISRQLSPAQRRLWFLDQRDGSSAEYNLWRRTRLSGPLDVQALTRALASVVARHAALRTRFVAVDGEPQRVVEPHVTVSLALVELSDVSPQPPDQEIERAVRLERDVPFDLGTAPLMRMKLLRITPTQHVLVQTIHHLVSDGYAQAVLDRDLWRAYEHARTGSRNASAYAASSTDDELEDTLAGAADAAASLAYWKREIEGAPPALELPLDRPRPSKHSYWSANVQTRIARDRTDRLKRWARQHGVTPLALQLCALALVLRHHSGQSDIVIGLPVANRSDPRSRETVGLSVNMVPIRIRLGAATTVAELLTTLTRSVLRARQHQGVPFDRIVAAAAPPRDLQVTPLFQVALAPQEPLESFDVAGLQVAPERATDIYVHHDIELHTWEDEGELVLCWLFRSALFDAWRIRQMAAQMSRALDDIVRHAEEPIDRIDLIDADERRRLLEDFGAGVDDTPSTTIVELFERRVDEAPHAVAVEDADTSMSYAGLRDRAECLARQLVASGVTRDAIVGVAVERSADLPAVLLGVLMAGGAYLPIPSEWPKPRIDALLGYVSHVVTTRSRLADFDAVEPTVMAFEDLLTLPPSSAPLRPLSPANAAYVNCTSGSTGVPKAVLVTHAGVVRLARQPDGASLSSQCRALQLSTLSFDAATFEIWGTLLIGATLVMAPPGRVTAQELQAIVRRHEIDTLFLTSGLFHEVVDTSLESFDGIDRLLTGGSVVSARHVEDVRRAWPNCIVVVAYGPTENTTFTCCHVVRPTDDLSVSVPIGRPVASTRMYVLDERLELVSTGVAGELYVAGAGLARGYVDAPAQTAERFVADPYGAPGSRMYRTGDLVRWRPDGSLEFIRRLDAQVKVRGFRVELAEVDGALVRIPGIQHATTVVRKDPRGETALVAYVVTSETRMTATDVRRSATQILPDFMVPAIVVVKRLPLTPTGKVDVRALEAMAGGEQMPAATRRPRTVEEKTLASIFEHVLGVPDVGLDDDFFDLGGHSLLAMRLAHRVHSATGLDPGIRAIFDNPTVAMLHDHLTGRGAFGGSATRTAATPYN